MSEENWGMWETIDRLRKENEILKKENETVLKNYHGKDKLWYRRAEGAIARREELEKQITEWKISCSKEIDKTKSVEVKLAGKIIELNLLEKQLENMKNLHATDALEIDRLEDKLASLQSNFDELWNKYCGIENEPAQPPPAPPIMFDNLGRMLENTKEPFKFNELVKTKKD